MEVGRELLQVGEELLVDLEGSNAVWWRFLVRLGEKQQEQHIGKRSTASGAWPMEMKSGKERGTDAGTQAKTQTHRHTDTLAHMKPKRSRAAY